MRIWFLTLILFFIISSLAFAQKIPNGAPFQDLQQQINTTQQQVDNLQQQIDNINPSFFDVFVRLDLLDQRLDSFFDVFVDFQQQIQSSFFDVFARLDTLDQQVVALNARIDDLCTRRCTMEYAPVCGADGKAYVNECGARCANVEIAQQGICQPREMITCCTSDNNCFPSTTDQCRFSNGAVMECMPVPPQDLPVPSRPVNFTSTNPNGPQSEWLRNLTNAVNSTGIHNGQYVNTTHDCDDFAHELETNLTELGYNATFTYYWCQRNDGTFFGHAVTDVHASDGTMVWYEPQTGQITNLDFDNDGTVETRNDHINNANAFTDDNCAIEVFDNRQDAVNQGVPMD